MILKTEKEYRLYDAINYSSLKEFDNNRGAYYRKYVLKEKEVKVLNQSMIIGSLVDCLLLVPEEFETLFKIAVCDKPSGQMGLFVDELYGAVLQYTNDNGEMTEKTENLLQYTFDRFKVKYPDKFKGKDYQYVIDNFNKKDKNGTSAYDYFIECLAGNGRIIIDEKLQARAEKIVNAIKFGKYSKNLFEGSRTTKNYYQKPIVGNLMGYEVKGLLDIITVNSTEKTIKGIDLKCVWSPESFNYSFLKMGYYLQASLYNYLLQQFRDDMGLTDYSIEPFEFLVCDTTLENLPHFYTTDNSILRSGMEGFVDKYGTKYNGVEEIIKDIDYCKKNSFYDSNELNNNNGKLKLKL